VTFCYRVGALGYPVYVDTGVQLGHQKTYLLTGDMYRQQRASLTTSPAGDSSQSSAGADTPTQKE
jgi:hypothetical protein